MSVFLTQVVLAAFAAIFVENTIFGRALGTSTLFLAARDRRQLWSFGGAMVWLCVASSALAFLADWKIPANAAYRALYMPMIYVTAVAIVYVLTLLALWKISQKIFSKVKKYVHLSAFNCAVLGVLFLNQRSGGEFGHYLGFGLGTGIGFVLAAWLFAAAYGHIYSDEAPDAFRGYPLALIYLGILSMALFGLSSAQLPV